MMFILAVAACARPDDDLVETRHGTSQIEQVPEPAVPEDHRRVEGPSSELSSIDSLMWRQPDSAFALLLQFVGSPEADGLDTYNGHYCQLLISELLYKNDYAQTNRQDLQKAVAYFDSLVWLSPPFKGVPEGRGIKTNLSNQNNTIPFLTARAHYINGAGYYEKDSVVEACAEYLKALEVMEGWFDDKQLKGKKAVFMTYTYNRLTELFSAQFMMDPAIACGEKALQFCRIEPTSPDAVSNILYFLGRQYDKMNDINNARLYYGKALEEITSRNNLVYRNIVSSKALCDYQAGVGKALSLEALRDILKQAENDNERATRFLIIGTIYYTEKEYDSSLLYLEPLFNNKDNESLRLDAAEHLRVIYAQMGNIEKLNECVHYIALQNESVAENKALISKLEDLFKTYLNQKQEKEAEAAREKAIKKTIGIIVPIAFVVALAIFVLAKVRSKKLLKDQQEEADRKLGETEQQHRMQQAALSGRLKKSNEELRDVSMQLEQTLAKTPSESMPHDDYAAYVNTAICQYIVGVVHEQQFKSKMDYLVYKDSALSKEQLLSLRNAAEKHLPRFVSQIRKQYSRLTESDMDYCCLFLLGLSEADVSALMQRAYTTVCDRSRKISRILGADDSLYHTLRNCLSEQ